MVVRRAVKQVAVAAGALAIAAAVTLGTSPAAQATPAGQTGAAASAKATTKPTAKPKPQPDTMTIVGGELPEAGIKVLQAEDPKLFRMLMEEVGWMAAATPQASAPKKDKLGPKYTVQVLIKEKATQLYELYPLATGGPRAHRPAAQPSGKKTDGWFYGRLSMSESLRLSGVPLKAKPDVVNGGIGGGIGENLKADDDPAASANKFIGEMRRLFLLNGAVLVIILTGLAGMAFLIRRRI
ncbi:hypothetical protein [Actinoplanes sp. L3-i22]|uniref:hypothetical protein n=1 Tax=Actinoplanes sp. L3-i22 TaxID=2836373 RepID=UPI001C76EA5B|nr:hypothetical protein [Actinoplanes sp. L3-i22]BCY06374.1 hypothetical protein L3i22_014620 [Actinoplanes sp. L3-i22]